MTKTPQKYRLTTKTALLVKTLIRDADTWGAMKEGGSGSSAVRAEKDFIASIDALLDRIQYLENMTGIHIKIGNYFPLTHFTEGSN